MTVHPIDWSQTLQQPILAVSFDEMEAGQAAAIESFLLSLAQQGFAKIRLEPGSLLNALSGGANIGRTQGAFRFPPLEGDVQYTPAHRACFRALYGLGRACLSWVLTGSRVSGDSVQFLLRRLNEAEAASKNLFGGTRPNHSPFSSSDEPFSSSFFNIFDYDYGLLNGHKDRYLTTTIFADSDPSTAHNRSVLWVRGRSGQWHNVDAGLKADEVVFMIGEELEDLLRPAGIPIYAAEHCIRVDPEGEFLARAHFRPDPDTLATGNRLSTAFILGASQLG